MARNVCVIDGCALFVAGRGWCSKHWTRWKRYGDPLYRIPGEVQDGKRICSRCCEDKPIEMFGRNGNPPSRGLQSRVASGLSATCKPCAAAVKRAKLAAGSQAKPKQPKTCCVCQQVFDGDNRNSKYCSDICARTAKEAYDRDYERDPEAVREAGRRWRQRYPDRNWRKAAAYRARKKASTIEFVDRGAIFERDRWTCHICMWPIDPSISHPDPLSPSVDHLVPLARGGEHSYANARAAHLRCNVRKGAEVA